MIVEIPNVCQKFVTVYLTCHAKKFRFIRFNADVYHLADLSDAAQICREFARFQTSGLTLDQFFDREIVVCRYDSRHVNSMTFKTQQKIVSRTPIFIGKAKAFHLIGLDQVVAKYPIQMTEQQLAKLFHLHGSFNSLPELYRYHPVSFKYVEVKSGKCYQTDDLPGVRRGNHFTITVGKSKNGKTFWVPASFTISKLYRCTKFPGKCLYTSLHAATTLRHMETCESESKIEAHQIEYGSDKRLMKSIINDGLLPENFLNYRHNYLATYDIESLERKVGVDQTQKLRIETHQFPVSVAVSTNLPNRSDKFYIRKVINHSSTK